MYFFNLIVCLNTIASMIKTNLFFDFTGFQVRIFERQDQHDLHVVETKRENSGLPSQSVGTDVFQFSCVFMIHVGGTRCVTSSTDNIMKIHFRITLNVEFIRGYIFKFLFYV